MNYSCSQPWMKVNLPYPLHLFQPCTCSLQESVSGVILVCGPDRRLQSPHAFSSLCVRRASATVCALLNILPQCGAPSIDMSIYLAFCRGGLFGSSYDVSVLSVTEISIPMGIYRYLCIHIYSPGHTVHGIIQTTTTTPGTYVSFPMIPSCPSALPTAHPSPLRTDRTAVSSEFPHRASELSVRGEPSRLYRS